MDLIRRIEELMKKRNMSQYKLAIESKTPHSTMSTLMNGKVKNPSLDMIQRIANALDVPMAALTGEEQSVAEEKAEYVVPKQESEGESGVDYAKIIEEMKKNKLIYKGYTLSDEQKEGFLEVIETMLKHYKK